MRRPRKTAQKSATQGTLPNIDWERTQIVIDTLKDTLEITSNLHQTEMRIQRIRNHMIALLEQLDPTMRPGSSTITSRHEKKNNTELATKIQ